jgi:ABC-type uncharacterized transport system ATPase component
LEQLASSDCTILLAIHNLEHGLAVGQRVIVLHRGHIIRDEHKGTIDPAGFAETYAALAGI